MTTKTLSTYAAGGYVLAPSYSELDITKTGGVGGSGVYTGHFATISNFGTINSTTTTGIAIGILFGPTSGGGVVINRAGGYIGGYDAVFSDAGLSLVNYGTIAGYHTAVEANSGGSLRNGSYRHKDALVSGSDIVFGTAAASTIANYGTIAVDLILIEGGGTVTNGGAGDTSALITGAGGIYMFGASTEAVRNFGTLRAAAANNGVNLGSGGLVTNGSVTDTVARIEGGTGVLLSGAGTVSNYGVIAGTGLPPSPSAWRSAPAAR